MQVVFTADSKLIGRLIRFFTKRSWLKSARTSHAALRYGGDEDKWMVEANEHGFVPNWWPKFIKIRKVYIKYEVIGCDEIILEKIIDNFIDEFILDKYDVLGLFGMLFVIIFYWITGKKIKNPFGRKSALTCSEVVYKIFKEVEKQTGIKYFKEMDPETTFPEELLMECESKPELFKEVKD